MNRVIRCTLYDRPAADPGALDSARLSACFTCTMQKRCSPVVSGSWRRRCWFRLQWRASFLTEAFSPSNRTMTCSRPWPASLLPNTESANPPTLCGNSSRQSNCESCRQSQSFLRTPKSTACHRRRCQSRYRASRVSHSLVCHCPLFPLSASLLLLPHRSSYHYSEIRPHPGGNWFQKENGLSYSAQPPRGRRRRQRSHIPNNLDLLTF